MKLISDFIFYAKNHRILIHSETRKIGICATLIGWGLIAFSTVLFSSSIRQLPASLDFLILFSSASFFLFIASSFKGFDFFKVREQRLTSINHEQKAHLNIRERKWLLFWRGFIASAGYMLYSWSRVSIGIIDNSAVFSTDAIVFALLIWLVLKENIRPITWLGIIIASFGVSFIFFFDFHFTSLSQSFVGAGAGLLSSIALAIIILLNTVIVQHEPPLRIAFYQCIVGLLLALLTVLINLVLGSYQNLSIPWTEVLYSICAGVIYAIALLFFFNAFLYTEPLTISVLGYALTPFVIIIEWIVTGHAASKYDWLSFVLISFGGGLVLFVEQRKNKENRIIAHPIYTRTLREKMKILKEDYLNGLLGRYEYMTLRHEFNKLLFQFASEIEKADIEKIEILNEDVIFTLKPLHMKLSCDGGCRSAPFEILNFGCYEPEESSLLLKVLKDCDTIFDVGAHIGWYSLNFGLRFPNSKIYAFEPIPNTFAYLEKNIKLNNVHNIEANNLALTDQEGYQKFYYFRGGSALASTVNLLGHEKIHSIDCSTQTLDNFCQNLKIDKVDFIKCDVEGSELAMINGGLGIIDRCKPIIYIELCEEWSKKFGYLPDDVVGILEKMNFQCYGLANDKLVRTLHIKNVGEKYNYFFFHVEKHNAIIREHS